MKRRNISEATNCTCVSTFEGWDTSKCGYHGKPKKPFVRFRMLLGNSMFMCPRSGQVNVYKDFRVVEIAKVRA